MASEIKVFVELWLAAAVCLIFCRHVAARVSAGGARLLFLLPIIYLLSTIPFRLTSVHLGGPTFFYFSWLANFKLLLFAFNQGPLAAAPPLSLLKFVSIGLLPINVDRRPPARSVTEHKSRRLLQFFLKSVLLAVIVSLYRYRESIHPYLIYALYCCHLYLGIELVLAITAAPARAFLGFELEKQFDEPYFATSLQDFWGRRWNLMVSSILRLVVYLPVYRISKLRWPAILSTFLVSGLMHEVIYYYFSRAAPTWEVTWFFLLHGFCVAAEVAVKKRLAGRFSLPVAVSRPLTLGFVAVTGAWLFFPQIIRYKVDLKAIDEYAVMVKFLTDQLPVPPVTRS